MKSRIKKAVVFGAVSMMLLGVSSAPAFATDPAPTDPPATAKCNSGRGNLSETDPANDCDPGNSAGHNSGGD